ncbi:MAG: hypothetical protein IV100_34130 [Myxococcales bacterium]|nr:hypothetical protein [Myxococcales bacterium]
MPVSARLIASIALVLASCSSEEKCAYGSVEVGGVCQLTAQDVAFPPLSEDDIILNVADVASLGTDDTTTSDATNPNDIIDDGQGADAIDTSDTADLPDSDPGPRSDSTTGADDAAATEDVTPQDLDTAETAGDDATGGGAN